MKKYSSRAPKRLLWILSLLLILATQSYCQLTEALYDFESQNYQSSAQKLSKITSKGGILAHVYLQYILGHDLVPLAELGYQKTSGEAPEAFKKKLLPYIDKIPSWILAKAQEEHLNASLAYIDFYKERETPIKTIPQTLKKNTGKRLKRSATIAQQKQPAKPNTELAPSQNKALLTLYNLTNSGSSRAAFLLAKIAKSKTLNDCTVKNCFKNIKTCQGLLADTQNKIVNQSTYKYIIDRDILDFIRQIYTKHNISADSLALYESTLCFEEGSYAATNNNDRDPVPPLVKQLLGEMNTSPTGNIKTNNVLDIINLFEYYVSAGQLKIQDDTKNWIGNKLYEFGYHAYYNANKIRLAEKYFSMGAKYGNYICYTFLGKMHFSGEIGEIDYKKAFVLFKLSAMEPTNFYGIYSLASMYLNGLGTEINFSEGYKCFKQFIDSYEDIKLNKKDVFHSSSLSTMNTFLGEVYGQLASLLFLGLGVEANIEKAKEYAELGTKLKDAYAQTYLSLIQFRNGEELEALKNITEASKSNPESIGIQLDLARIFIVGSEPIKNLKEAKKILQKVKQKPKWSNHASLVYLEYLLSKEEEKAKGERKTKDQAPILVKEDQESITLTVPLNSTELEERESPILLSNTTSSIEIKKDLTKEPLKELDKPEEIQEKTPLKEEQKEKYDWKTEEKQFKEQWEKDKTVKHTVKINKNRAFAFPSSSFTENQKPPKKAISPETLEVIHVIFRYHTKQRLESLTSEDFEKMWTHIGCSFVHRGGSKVAVSFTLANGTVHKLTYDPPHQKTDPMYHALRRSMKNFLTAIGCDPESIESKK